jgi:uncharacterized Ntn-hydrolase superfamily protein
VTYSIVARDAGTGALGVAVQSHFFSVGSVVPWAEPGVGAVATQAFAEAAHGPRGLALLREGRSAPEALRSLAAGDPGAAYRQLAVVDAAGRADAHTGAACLAHAGHECEPDVTAQGNMLASPAVPAAMIEGFRSADGRLAERLLAALDAGEAAGGDIRGRQSAALLVVGDPAGEVELRVEDHEEPLVELRRLLRLRRAYDRIGAAILGSGLLIAEGADVSEEAIAALGEAQDVLGPNPEATFWRAVLLARSGRIDEARADADRATAVTPRLTELLRALPAAGILTAEALDRLLPEEGVRA